MASYTTYRFAKHLQHAAPLGVEFVTRLICAFDTKRLQYNAETTGLASTPLIHEPPRRPIEIRVQVELRIPQNYYTSLSAISNDGQGWRCPDPIAAELIQSPEAQLALDATSAIFRAREPLRATQFAADYLPDLNISGHQIRNQDTKEWFERAYQLRLETYDEVLVAHSAAGLFHWLRKTKQIGGRRSNTGASQFVEQQLGRFRAECALAALRNWNAL